MTYLITALDAEARPLIEHYRLKRDHSLPYTLYKNDDTLLLVSGMGKMNAAMAVSTLLGWRIPGDEDILMNVGVCGAPKSYKIGEALLIHQIIDNDRHYYPDILYTHPLQETSLICVDTPQSELSDYPVDMESASVFKAASRFFKLHQMAFIKIVSDHCTPESVTKEQVIEQIASNLSAIESVRHHLQSIQNENTLFTREERCEIEVFKTHFTKSQGDSLEDALSFFRLKNPTNSIRLTFDIPHSKRERSTLLEELITSLTA